MQRRFARPAILLCLLGCNSGKPPPAARTTAKPSAVPSASSEPELSRVPPAVSLGGERQTVPGIMPGSPRLYAKALRVWVHERPSPESRKLGYFRAGSSSPIEPKPVGREGCPDGWYPVKPVGYVCAGREATLDAGDPVVVATRDSLPDPGRRLPYIYGTVRRPGPIYARLPTVAELGQTEPDLGERMAKWLGADGEVGAGYAQQVWLGGSGEPPDPAQIWASKTSDKLPGWLEPRGSGDLVQGSMKPRAGYSFLRTWLWQGRRYGLTPELALMPTDRLRPIQGSENHGVEIGPGKPAEFPFALVRRRGAKLHTRSAGRLVEAEEAPYFSAVKLTGKQNFFGGRLYFETADGKWISDQDGSRLDPVRRLPKWGKNGEKWIDVNLTKQTVVLFEGERAVYATLISSGEAGLEDPQHTTATKRGIFRIHTKHVSATMSSEEVGEEFELRDVPYVQYFDKGGYALHGAYWHDRFGTPKSHGCLNLSPEDARRIFYWTEPEVPVGWHGVLKPLTGTTLFIHP
jgi:hypothetical protein